MEYRFYINGVLIDEPIGWDSASFKIKRDETFKGLFFEYVSDLQFIGTGFTIIRDTYEADGVDAELFLRVDYQCNEGAEFEEVFTGRFDLTSFKKTISDMCSCTCNIEDLGPSARIKTLADTTINVFDNTTIDGLALPPYTNSPYQLTMHSKQLLLQTFYDSAYESLGEFDGITTGEFFAFSIAPSLDIDQFEGAQAVAANSIFGNNSLLPGALTNAVIFNSTEAGSFDINFQAIGTLAFNAPTWGLTFFKCVCTLVKFDSGGGSYDPTTLFEIDSDGETGTINKTYTINQSVSTSKTLAVGDKLGVVFLFSNIASGNFPTNPVNADFSVNLSTAEFKISKASTTAATEANAFLVYEAFNRVAQNVLNQTDAFRSEHLGRTDSQPLTYGSNGCGAFMALANGFQVRGFPSYPLYLTLRELFESLSAVWAMGMGLEQIGDEYIIRVENLDYFFSDTVLLTLDGVYKIEESVNPEYIYSDVTIGYGKFGTEQGTSKTNTIDAFATTYEFVSPVRTSKQSFEMLSRYIADHYTIEFTRRNRYVDNATEAWNFDEDVFLLCLNRSDLTECEKDENYASVTGILSPETSYNLRISPKRNLLRWSKYLVVGWNKMAGRALKFLKASYPTEMQSEFSSDTCPGSYNNANLNEYANLAWDDVDNLDDTPVWKPVVATFEYPLSWSEYQLLKSSPSGCIDYGPGKGYILELTYKPVQGLAEFVLLVSNS